MPISNSSPQKQLYWNDFPNPNRIIDDTTSDKEPPFRVRDCFRQLLEQYEESEFIKYLVAPSAEALSGYFHCTTEEVEQGLKLLKQLGYDYEYRGNHRAITLWDPLIRDKTVRRASLSRLKLMYENFFMIPTPLSH